MPTGYTSDLYDGKPQTFAEFALSCSRAFGALILMRDDPADAPIPDEFAPSDYDLKALAKAQAEAYRLARLTPGQAQAEATAARQEWEAARVEAERVRVARKGRYEAMLARVKAWDPPTPEHVGMKEFMAQQLRESIDFDCSHSEFEAPTSDGPTWLNQALGKAARDIVYHRAEHAKEVERAAGRSAWVQALRSSLSDRGSEAVHAGASDATTAKAGQ